MTQNHHYPVQILWTGNRGQGTSHYRDYDRSHEILIEGKPTILGSSDPTFRGDAHRHNPEEMLVASLSACHMLWYLHLCATSSVVVTHYLDRAIGTMVETPEGGGHFSKVVLQPVVTITATSDPIKAKALHSQAHHLCFIANSVNFPVDCEPLIQADHPD
ncbi:OsmC family protein [Leptolyngbya sp. PCC 6406]|uniref:OsmC family protein n=1 Tax=Leptolyngbya sp. PCC 6406 TaxID=1173264 RepID=UPI0002AB9BA2|nr:OsmC family protein [Leptolyngbya sp. PCC 6406]